MHCVQDWHVHRQGPWSLQLRPARAGDADCIYYLRFDYDSAESDGNRQLKLWHKVCIATLLMYGGLCLL